MGSPAFEITGGLAALLKESLQVVNALREKEILILLLKQKGNSPLFDQRK
jgi:hypothetical protein